MRVVFAIDHQGQLSEIGEMLRVAIDTCVCNTSHSPFVIADSFSPEFATWLDSMNVERAAVVSPMREPILAANARSGYPLQGAGNYLRYEACNELDDSYFLYCDCDVIFLGDFEISEPRGIVGAVAEDELKDWSRFNSGVLLINNVEMKNVLADFYKFALMNLERFLPGFDQPALNEFFAGRIFPISADYNWRPYWGVNPNAKILHMHGVKLEVLEAMAQGVFIADAKKRDQITELCVRTAGHLSRFLDGIHPEIVGRHDWLSRYVALLAKLRLVESQPLLEYFAGLSQVYERVTQNWERSELAFIKRKLKQPALSVRNFASEYRNETRSRYVIDSEGLLIAVSDLCDADGHCLSPLAQAAMRNVKVVDTLETSGKQFYVLRKSDPEVQADIVFTVSSGFSRLGTAISVVGCGSVRIKRYWTDEGPFDESRAEKFDNKAFEGE